MNRKTEDYYPRILAVWTFGKFRSTTVVMSYDITNVRVKARVLQDWLISTTDCSSNFGYIHPKFGASLTGTLPRKARISRHSWKNTLSFSRFLIENCTFPRVEKYYCFLIDSIERDRRARLFIIRSR